MDGITEKVLFFLLMILAAFLRIYRLDSVPPGIFVDQGYEGWTALRILHEGFRPTWEAGVFQNPALLLYQLAAWFSIMPAGRFTLYLFFALLSLATLPLFYWTIRELAGARTALLSLFFLAVMRWNMTFSRNGFPTIQVPLYIFGTLAFLLLGLRTGKRWAFYLSAGFFGLGFYTYQAYKAFPLWLLLLGLYALIRHRQTLLARRYQLLVFTALAFLLLLPFLSHSLSISGMGNREDSISILSKIVEKGDLSPLWENIRDTALMFHWKGDTLSRHNLPDHRMLDDGTGILFLFGCWLAFFNLWNKVSFFALTGLGVMTLPGILSINAAHANRLLGLTPLVALLAALPLIALWEIVSVSPRPFVRKAFTVLFILTLGMIAIQNFSVYFGDQAANADAFEQFDSEETFAGQKCAQYGAADDLYFSPYYDQTYSLNFLSYSHREHFHFLRVPEDLGAPLHPSNRGKGFFLESNREGLLWLLRNLYPQGKLETFFDPNGELSMGLYLVPPSELEKKRGLPTDRLIPRGLIGYYYNNPGTLDPPALVHRDPLLNFPNEGSFPLKAPFILWKGSLVLPRTGVYGFSFGTWGQASLSIDGKEWIPSGGTNGSGFLKAGTHSVLVTFQNPGGRENWSFNFYWRPPGQERLMIVPNQVFGRWP